MSTITLPKFPPSRDLAKLLLYTQGDNVLVSRLVNRIIDPETGYLIGAKTKRLRLRPTEDRERLIAKLSRWLDELPANVIFVESWIRNNILYVEGVDIEADYFDSLLLGFERLEDAIYDLSSGARIPLKGEELKWR